MQKRVRCPLPVYCKRREERRKRRRRRKRTNCIPFQPHVCRVTGATPSLKHAEEAKYPRSLGSNHNTLSVEETQPIDRERERGGDGRKEREKKAIEE